MAGLLDNTSSISAQLFPIEEAICCTPCSKVARECDALEPVVAVEHAEPASDSAARGEAGGKEPVAVGALAFGGAAA